MDSGLNKKIKQKKEHKTHNELISDSPSKDTFPDLQNEVTLADYGRETNISIEEVRQLEKYKNYSIDQIKELITTIKTYTQIIYNLCSKRSKSGKVFELLVENENILNHEQRNII